ncbi:MAG TPA: AraC family transcriptional regulator [Verrucomicrobiales bacterium]|nr:AraC family transcriptional regulator [Verrucomicrobiales bacterium]
MIGVRVDRQDDREWIRPLPVCALLHQHHIAHAGLISAAVPFRVVRKQQGGTYFLACHGGEGSILVDGRWQRIRSGTACLLPPRTLNAFHAVPGRSWEYCWVRYQQPDEQRPVATSHSPVQARYDPEPLRAAITGLHHECSGAAAPAQMHHWVELIHSYVMRFARPLQDDDRLWHLWQKVTGNLEQPWTIERLAREGHVSGEHLRRLCRRQLGRSPMQHVTWLRMQKAGELLTTTGDKIESIAAQVGYRNPFVFSTTFKKWIGWRPTEFRAQG